MRTLKDLFDNNQAWAAQIAKRDPGFFERLSRQQAPEYLWIGCSDSRVPANDIVGLLPGELFVHRNIANVVTHTDLNCLSVLQYAVEALRVKHIIVCGHYGCGGVQAAMRNEPLGLIDNWLRRVQDVQLKHGEVLGGVPDESALFDRMCELNVIEQTYNVCRTTVVEHAWSHGQSLSVHGWMYSLKDGLLRDLGMCASGANEVADCYRAAIQSVKEGGSSAATLRVAEKAKPDPRSAPGMKSAPPPPERPPPPATPPPAPLQSSHAGQSGPPPLPRLK